MEQRGSEHLKPKPPKVSRSAFDRIFALLAVETQAARTIIKGDSYPDFFVEGSGPPWHEAFEDVITAGRQEFSDQRMAYIDLLPRADDDGYSDFFVEGSGPPWHEAFGDAVEGDYLNPRVRIASLRKLNVVEAYARLREANIK